MRKLPVHIPQNEFGFTVQTFNLFQETAVDGDRVTRERQQTEQARQTADAAQHRLFDLPRKKHSHRCRRCGSAVYCYKTQCQKPQRVDRCQYCK